MKELTELVNQDAGSTIDWLIENQYTHVILTKEHYKAMVDLLRDIADSNCKTVEFTDEISRILNTPS